MVQPSRAAGAVELLVDLHRRTRLEELVYIQLVSGLGASPHRWCLSEATQDLKGEHQTLKSAQTGGQ